MPDDKKQEVADPARAAIYEQFEKSQQPLAEEKPPVEEKKEEQPISAAPADKGASESHPVKGEETSKKEGVDEAKPDETGKVEMVPHAALHEERIKRQEAEKREKESAARIKILEEQQAVLLNDLKKSMERPSDDPGETDLDKVIRQQSEEIKTLKASIEALKTGDSKRADWERQERERKEAEGREATLGQIDTDLAKAGFPGFNRFRPLVAAELDKLIQKDEANKHLNTPEGLKKIYRESVFPSVRELFIKQKMEEKKDAKKDVALIGSPGSAPAKEDSPDKPWTMDDYLKMRRGQGK